MAKLNLPEDSLTVRICYQSEHELLYKSNMLQQKIRHLFFTKDKCKK